MKLTKLLIILIALLLPATVAAKDDLPLPRYVSLKSEEANVRKGPGLNYKIKWVLVKKKMPLEVIAEFEQWRKIRDMEGGEGWVHRAMIDGRRTVTVTKFTHTMRKEPDAEAYAVALVEVGVNAELLECDEHWCRIDTGDYRGWVERDGLWGIYPDEEIN